MDDMTQKIVACKKRIGERAIDIEVDGGIKVNNVKTVLDAGADTIVAGSAVLGGDDAMEKARAFMEILA